MSRKDFKIKLLEHNIDVRFKPEGNWGDSCLGQCDLSASKITLLDTMSDDLVKSTFFHEVFHLIGDMSSIPLKENEVDILSIGIISLLNNNPELLEQLLENK